MSTQNNNVPRGRRIDPLNVPEPFRPLIPYAEKWGISDDGYLDDAIDQASIEELRDLVTAISEFDAEGFGEWLGNPGTANYTKEWIAFVSLINAYDLAKLRLQSENNNATD